MDKKSRVVTMPIGASSPQAIGGTHKLPYPFGLYQLLDVWCIMGDKHCGHIDYMYSDFHGYA